MTLKLVDLPSGPGPLSVLMLGVVMAVTGSGKAEAQLGQKGPLTFGPDGCTLNHQENCTLDQLKQQMAFPKAGDLVRWHSAEAIGRLGGPAEAKDMAEAVIRESGNGPNVMNSVNPVDPFPKELEALTRLAALPGAPDVGVQLMKAFEDVYKRKHDRLLNADDNARPYLAQHWEEGPQFSRLTQALGVVPATADMAREMEGFLNATAGDGPSNARDAIVSLRQNLKILAPTDKKDNQPRLES